MTTKEKNVAIYLNVPESLKKDFVELAGLGTNYTNLLKMLMKRVINEKSIEFKKPQVLDFEIEPLDISNWSPKNIKKAEKLTQKWNNLNINENNTNNVNHLK